MAVLEENTPTILGGAGGGPREGATGVPPRRRVYTTALTVIALVIASALFTIHQLTQAPAAFQSNTLVEVPVGYTLGEIAALLEKASIIRSPIIFKLLVQHYGKEKGITAGTYLFESPETVFVIARRMAVGFHGIQTVKITLPEGMSAKEMSAVLARSLTSFDETAFLNDTKGQEGYLFPDTYFFFANATSGPVAHALGSNFLKRTDALKREAVGSQSAWSDIITMASIIEGEAATPDDRRIVSGILWKRLAQGMRLQVDATFAYTIGKGSLELTADDLASDSPYNTYKYAGLPPGPIGNPGLDAINASLHPEDTPYLYYLSDADGVMHYAKTFAQHKLNKAKYLR